MEATYNAIGLGYRKHRLPDARIGAQIAEALGSARTVLNVGAGAGSYEPTDREVTALEPSAVMIGQRPPSAAPAVQGYAESLPFDDGSFEAAMAVLTVHHWSDFAAGLHEMTRVANRVIILTFDRYSDYDFWLTRDYFPEFDLEDEDRFPPMARYEAALGPISVDVVPIPADCTDGFLGAWWARPEAYFEPTVRAGISSFSAREPDEYASGLAALAADLESGEWKRRNGHLLQRPALDLGYRLITARSTIHSQKQTDS